MPADISHEALTSLRDKIEEEEEQEPMGAPGGGGGPVAL